MSTSSGRIDSSNSGGVQDISQLSPAKKYADNQLRYPAFEPLEEIWEQYAAELAGMQAAIAPLECTDKILMYRFLKGFKMDVAVAASELKKTVAWRESEGMNDIRAEILDGLTWDAIPYAQEAGLCFKWNQDHKTDKLGQPMEISCLGQLNLDVVLDTFPEDTLLHHHKYIYEMKAKQQTEVSNKLGHLVRFTRIIDLKGIGMGMVSNLQGVKLLKSVLGQGTDNYPETLAQMYIINAPKAFTLLWNVVRPMLKMSTQRKIQILGSEYQDILLEAIDSSSLPPEFGGTCDCKGGCLPVIPEPDAGLEALYVPRRDVVTYTAELKAGETADWCLRVTDKDIDLVVSIVEEGQEAVETSEKVSWSAVKKTKGSYTAQSKPATVTVKLDNTFSRFTGKNVLFKLSQTPPQ